VIETDKLLELCKLPRDEQIARMAELDWTVSPVDGKSNSSPAFEEMATAVEELIRQSAHTLLAGRADTVARLIVAQLAHVHHMAPVHEPR
jgi:hypothetical protein